MGFLQLLESRPMSLLVSLPANDPALVRAAVAGGADAIKVHINVDHRASGNRFGSLALEKEALLTIREIAGERPLGLVGGGHGQVPLAEISEAISLGYTTISMYAHHLPAHWLSLPGAQFMVAPDHTYTAAEIRSLAELPVDVIEASIVHPDGYGQPLTVRDLLQYQLVVRETKKPVVVPTQRLIRPEDLPALQAVGVRAVMIGAVVTGRQADELLAATQAFRRAIDRL